MPLLEKFTAVLGSYFKKTVPFDEGLLNDVFNDFLGLDLLDVFRFPRGFDCLEFDDEFILELLYSFDVA